jgi:hypothetical protein
MPDTPRTRSQLVSLLADNTSQAITAQTLRDWLASIDLTAEADAKRSYLHVQGAASATWVINHNLNRYPNVSVMSSTDDVVIGDVHYDSLNQITITFAGAFSGKAVMG